MWTIADEAGRGRASGIAGSSKQENTTWYIAKWHENEWALICNPHASATVCAHGSRKGGSNNREPRLKKAERRWQPEYQRTRSTSRHLPILPAPQTVAAALNVFFRLGFVGTLSFRSFSYRSIKSSSVVSVASRYVTLCRFFRFHPCF